MRRSHGAIASCFYHAQGTAKEIFWLLLTYLFQSLKGVYPRSFVTNKMDDRDARSWAALWQVLRFSYTAGSGAREIGDDGQK
jgi:hypothetical protein